MLPSRKTAELVPEATDTTLILMENKALGSIYEANSEIWGCDKKPMDAKGVLTLSSLAPESQ